MRRVVAALAVAVVARLALHAVFLPAFEGADEPDHLARVVMVATGTPASAFVAPEIPASVAGAVAAYPCAPALSKWYGCAPFGAEAAAFNLLAPRRPARPAGPFPNAEGNQPPLYYLAAGLPLRLLRAGADIAGALLYTRLLSVLFVAAALFGPLRIATRSWSSGGRAAGLLVLLLPGAAESLARASNDAAVFLWVSCVLAALEGRPRSAGMCLLLAAGPLLKLTAIPVVAFAVAALVLDRRPATAAAGTASALVVLPVQWARGWIWGGTVELNRATAAIGEPPLRFGAGFARSAYAFVKTSLWVGGWSLLRPPPVLAAGYLLLLGAALLLAEPRRPPRRLAPHLVALAVAAAGFAVFAVANRRYYGVWGGVAGWYLWGWSPWLAAAAADLGRIRRSARRPLLWAAVLFVLVANAVWLAASVRAYGI